MLEIVNYCNKCGAPIYGKRKIVEGDNPSIKRTCCCYESFQCQSTQSTQATTKPKSLLDEANRIEELKKQQKDIRDTMHTK